MAPQSNTELTFDQLIVRAACMDFDEQIDIYLDPLARFWYMTYVSQLKFWIPTGATFIGRGAAKDLLYILETFMANSVRQLIREEKL